MGPKMKLERHRTVKGSIIASVVTLNDLYLLGFEPEYSIIFDYRLEFY